MAPNSESNVGIASRSGRRQWFVFLVAALGAAYAWSGVVMNGSFAAAAATAGDIGAHRKAVYIFVALCIVCMAIALGASISLWRSRSRSRPAI